MAHPLAVALIRVTAPTRTAGCDWLARRLFSTSCPDWFPYAPNQQDHSPASPVRPPPAPHLVSIREGGGAGLERMERGPPMETPREGRGVCPRGTVQPMGMRFTSQARARLPWRLGFRRVAPRATPGCWSSGKEAHSNGVVNAAGTNLEDRERPLWRALALPTWGPAPSDGVGSGP